jgi:hypothetical protein
MTQLQFDPMRETPPPSATAKSGRGLWIAVAGVALAAMLGLWLVLRANRPADPRSGETQARTSAPAAPSSPEGANPMPQPSPPQTATPELAHSDAFVRALATELFGSAELDNWLAAGEELVHRGVRAILAISEQRSARRFLDFLPLEGRFETRRSGGGEIIAPENYRRYDRLVDIFVGLDSERLARFVERLGPLLSQAMDENAFPGTEFKVTLAGAIEHLLSTPSPSGDVEVTLGEDGVYRFADPRLEALSPPQKQLLRLGPGNGARVRAKLDELRLALDAVPRSV